MKKLPAPRIPPPRNSRKRDSTSFPRGRPARYETPALCHFFVPMLLDREHVDSTCLSFPVFQARESGAKSLSTYHSSVKLMGGATPSSPGNFISFTLRLAVCSRGLLPWTMNSPPNIRRYGSDRSPWQ